MMKEQLEAIRKGALEAIAGTKAAAELDALRVKYLGKKGELTSVLKQMGKLSAEERPVIGQIANEVRETLTKAIADNNARIIDPAYGSSTPAAPRSVIILFIALLFGLATPFGIIYLMEILDTTIRGRKDIEDKLSIPFLGDIPEYHGSTRQGSVVVRDNGRDSVSEAFRLIRSNLGFMSVKSGKLQIIMVTSSNPHAGKTFVTTNLAMTLALADKKVVIVDLDLRRRTLSKQMGQRDNRNGVSGYISGTIANLNDIVFQSGLHENLDIIFAGLQPPNPAEMLLSEKFDEFMADLRKRYDYVVIDSVPAMAVADALITDRLADLTIYVIREGLLDRRQLPDIEKLYREKKFHNMSIVLNGSTGGARRGYGYGEDESQKSSAVIDSRYNLTQRLKDFLGLNDKK